MRSKLKTKRSYIIAGLHLVVWLLLFSLNFLFVRNIRVEFETWFHLKVWLIYFVLFYLNYYLLMTFLLFRKKYLIYFASILILLSVCAKIKSNLELSRFQKRFAERGSTVKFTRNGNPIFFRDSVPRDDSKKVPGSDTVREIIRAGNHTFIINAGRPPEPRGPFRILGIDLFSLYGILLIFTASTSIRFIQRWQDEERKKTELDKEKVSTELSFLKQQINPHFLFNALNSIYSLSISQKKETTDAILKLSSILRYMLYETDKKFVLLYDELEVLNNYIELQKLRLTDKVSVSYLVTGEPGNLKIAPLLLIPLIENAFKHGVDNVQPSFIDLKLLISESRLNLTISNKVVNKTVVRNSHSGIGIKNIRRRLDLQYPYNHTFEIIQKENVFTILLDLKLQE